MILEPKYEEFRARVKKIVEKEILPTAQKIDESGEFPFENMKKLAACGFLGASAPQKYSGLGLDAVSFVILIEELSRVCASTALSVAAHNSLATSPINLFGTEEQKQKYIPPLAKGEKLGAFCLTEPEAGSDAGSTKTFAVLKNGYYVINGTKCFVTNGSVAETFVITARTRAGKDKSGISAFILEKNFTGISAGKKENKLGMRGSDTAFLHLEDVKVPKENLLGEEGNGFRQFLTILDSGRIGIGAMACGIAQAALEDSLKFAKERVQFERPIAQFQAIAWKLADMATRLEAARHLVYASARLKDKGEDFTKEAAMAKLFASEMGNFVTYQAIQILGGYGYMQKYSVERYFRDNKLTEIGEGTSEIQRIVISRSLLKEN